MSPPFMLWLLLVLVARPNQPLRCEFANLDPDQALAPALQSQTEAIQLRARRSAPRPSSSRRDSIVAWMASLTSTVAGLGWVGRKPRLDPWEAAKEASTQPVWGFGAMGLLSSVFLLGSYWSGPGPRLGAMLGRGRLGLSLTMRF